MSEDKKNKEGKKSMDFDFSNISGQRRKKEPTKKVAKEKKEVVTGKDDKNQGIVLSFPVEKGWDHKDIAQMSGEEFLLWTSRVYPGPINVSPEKLEKLSARMTIFKKILHYHVHSPFQMGKVGVGVEKKKENLLN